MNAILDTPMLTIDTMVALQKQVNALEARIQELENNTPQSRLSIIVSSNEFDKLMPAFILATGAVSMGMEAHLFFTFWGLTALKQKSSYEGKNMMEKMMTFMLPSGIDDVKLSKMNMMGAGKVMFENLMKKHNITSLSELLSLSIEMGVQICACEMTMTLMGIQREELVNGINYGGVAKYLECADRSRITLFM